MDNRRFSYENRHGYCKSTITFKAFLNGQAWIGFMWRVHKALCVLFKEKIWSRKQNWRRHEALWSGYSLWNSTCFWIPDWFPGSFSLSVCVSESLSFSALLFLLSLSLSLQCLHGFHSLIFSISPVSMSVPFNLFSHQFGFPLSFHVYWHQNHQFQGWLSHTTARFKYQELKSQCFLDNPHPGKTPYFPQEKIYPRIFSMCIDSNSALCCIVERKFLQHLVTHKINQLLKFLLKHWTFPFSSYM